MNAHGAAPGAGYTGAAVSQGDAQIIPQSGLRAKIANGCRASDRSRTSRRCYWLAVSILCGLGYGNLLVRPKLALSALSKIQAQFTQGSALYLAVGFVIERSPDALRKFCRRNAAEIQALIARGQP